MMESLCDGPFGLKTIQPPKKECLEILAQRFKELNGIHLRCELLWKKLLFVLELNLDNSCQNKLNTTNILDYANSCLNLKLDPLLVEYVKPVFLDIYNKIIPRPTFLGYQFILFSSKKIKGFEFEEGPLNKNSLSSFVKCYVYHEDFDKPLIGMAYTSSDTNEEMSLHNIAFMRAVRLAIGNVLIALDDFPYINDKRVLAEKIEIKPQNVDALLKFQNDKSECRLGNQTHHTIQEFKTLDCSVQDINIIKEHSDKTKKSPETKKIQDIFGGDMFF